VLAVELLAPPAPDDVLPAVAPPPSVVEVTLEPPLVTALVLTLPTVVAEAPIDTAETD
jgi:hypothetical protein